jgi:hypothetical protein
MEGTSVVGYLSLSLIVVGKLSAEKVFERNFLGTL